MTLQELQARIKSASDRMRADDNTKNALRYLEQITWLLFLKVYDGFEETRRLEAAVDGRAYHRVIPEQLAWSSWARGGLTGDALIEFVNATLLPGLRELRGTGGAAKIAEVFGSVTTVMKSGHSLAEVIEIVDEIDFHSVEDHHAMSVIYETLLAQTADAGWSGEFYTPRTVVEFIVDIVRPQLGETVYDPCCGSAGFLVGAAEYMKSQVRVGSDEVALERQTFFGQESGDLAHLVGTMNLILHGIAEPNTVRVNTLEQNVMNVSPAEQHGVILTNPPFGGTENPQVQQNFSSRSAATELLFLQHCMSKLRKGGRAAIVLPDGILYRANTAFSAVRRRLVNDFRLTGVVRLPTGVFPTAADTRTNILFFERTPTTEEVRYYQVRPPAGKRSYSKTNPVPRTALEGARAWLVDGVPDDNSWVVTRSQIDEEGHLDFAHPHDGAFEGDDDPLERVDELGQGSKTLAQMVNDLDAVVEGLDAMSVARWTALDEYVVQTGFRAGSRVPDRFLGVSNEGGIGPFKGAPGEDLSRYRRVSVGDFVYNPMRVNVGSIALCRTEAETGWASPDYVVFRLNDGAPFSREYLLAYLKSAAGKAEIVRRSRGAVRRRLYYDDLRNVQVPVPDDADAWEAVVTGLAALRSHVRRLHGVAAVAASSIERSLFERSDAPVPER